MHGSCVLLDYLRFSLPVSREKTRVGSAQISPPLTAEQFAIDPHIADQHFEPFLERFARNLSILHILVFGERYAVRQRPGVTLTRDRAQLVGDSEALFVRSDDGGKKLAGKFAPEMI